jgi:hypothetical protein
MLRLVASIVFLCLATHTALACTTEETLTVSLQASTAGVQVKQRFDALHAQKFFALFARVTEADDLPLVDRVVIYTTHDASTYTVVAFFAGCMLGHGAITRDTYRTILGQLRWAMSL